MIKWRPLVNLVWVKVKKVEKITEGGIYLPENTKDKEQVVTTEGVIDRIGANAWEEYSDKPPVKVGDTVLFRRSAGVIRQEGDVQYRIMNEDDVLAVLDDK